MEGKHYTLILLFLFSVVSTTDVYARIKELTSDREAKKVKDRRPDPARSMNFNAHAVGIGIGQTFLQGDFKDNGRDNIGWELLYNYSASYSYDMLVTGHFSSHKNLQRRTQLAGLTVGIKARIFQFDSFAPFVHGGLGFYSPVLKRPMGEEGVLTRSRSQVTFGTQVGLGAELTLNPSFKMGLMGHYHNPFDIKQDSGPDVEGSYFKLLITFLYVFQQ